LSDQLYLVGTRVLDVNRRQQTSALMTPRKVRNPIIEPMWGYDSGTVGATIAKLYPMIRTAGVPSQPPLKSVERRLGKAARAILQTAGSTQVSPSQ
jgi:hypothetical protein